MNTTAALYVAAAQHVDNATGKCAHQYYLGVRDTLEGVVRMVYGLEGQIDIRRFTRGILDEMDERASRQVLSDAYAVLEDRRRATIGETVSVVS